MSVNIAVYRYRYVTVFYLGLSIPRKPRAPETSARQACEALGSATACAPLSLISMSMPQLMQPRGSRNAWDIAHWTARRSCSWKALWSCNAVWVVHRLVSEYPPTPADARGSAPGNNTFDPFFERKSEVTLGILRCSFGVFPSFTAMGICRWEWFAFRRRS